MVCDLGSVSFQASRFMESTGKRFRHWVTVFEHEHDDIFDGQLGEQDDEQPRILLDYSIAQATRSSFRKELTRRNVQN